MRSVTVFENKYSAVAEMGDNLATIDVSLKLGAVPLFGGGAGSYVTQCGLRWGLPSYQVASSSIQPYGHNRHGPKFGGRGLCPLGGGAGSASNTMLPGSRPTIAPSGILIHPDIWPQQTWAENWKAVPPFREWELGTHLAQCGLSQGLPPYQVASWSMQPFGHNRRGPKIGGSAPFGE